MAIIGLVLVGFSADIMDLRNRTGHRRYSIKAYYWNETTDSNDVYKNGHVLGKPGQIEYTSYIATLCAGCLCTVIGIIVGSLVFRYRYSLFKLQLADSQVGSSNDCRRNHLRAAADLRDPQKYSWIFPTCVALDTMLLIVVNDIAVVAGLKEGVGNNWWLMYYQFSPKYMLNLAPTVPNYHIWMFNPDHVRTSPCYPSSKTIPCPRSASKDIDGLYADMSADVHCYTMDLLVCALGRLV